MHAGIHQREHLKRRPREIREKCRKETFQAGDISKETIIVGLRQTRKIAFPVKIQKTWQIMSKIKKHNIIQLLFNPPQIHHLQMITFCLSY